MPPIRELPAHYHEVLHLVVTEGKRLLWLNLLALIPLVVSLVVVGAWWLAVARLRGPIAGDGPPWLLGILLLLATMPLHEAIHALAIRLVGHRPRFGAKLDKGVLYATADQALFRRDEFIAVALAPIVFISISGLTLMVVLPDAVAYWIGLAIVLNAASAIGDLWMTAVVLRYPPNALVRDEADGIRIFTQA